MHYVDFLKYFPPFVGHFEFLNISKCSMMPRWHHYYSSSERYQEVKSIKTFYTAHISRSQAKSMFGNWTILRTCTDVHIDIHDIRLIIPALQNDGIASIKIVLNPYMSNGLAHYYYLSSLSFIGNSGVI